MRKSFLFLLLASSAVPALAADNDSDLIRRKSRDAVDEANAPNK